MPRCSDWRIVWDPEGVAPRVLLDFDDTMEEEIDLPAEALQGRIRSDFAASVVPLARGNVRRRLQFSRRQEHSTAAESWEACSAAIIADRWEKAVITIEPRGGEARNYLAALETASHEPVSGFPAGVSLHRYRLRLARTTSSVWVPDGDPIPVIGGVYNPGGPIVIELPPGHGINPGDEVEVTIPGVGTEHRPVTGVDGNHISIPGDAEPDAVDLDSALQWIRYVDQPGDPHHLATRRVIFHIKTAGLPLGEWRLRVNDPDGATPGEIIADDSSTPVASRTDLRVDNYFFEEHLAGREFVMGGDAFHEEYEAPNPSNPEHIIHWSYSGSAPTEMLIELRQGGETKRSYKFQPRYSAPMVMVFGGDDTVEQDSHRDIFIGWNGGSLSIPAQDLEVIGTEAVPIGLVQKVRREQE